ncbi:hypothetical protein FGO68_gene13373 [Halteria grandinella]|uniref:Macro domain-containing protein n=1 Tax=Halteria grandinella TaxID=5974 RepID=A0A8J8SXU0_HALGN|nr:hypothetical protein FGO68_gene13373 [Halteria grandinella]
MIQNQQKLHEYRFGKISVSVEQGNLVTLKNVGAIVNAANVYLCSGGGVCGAIFDACGEDELTKECKEYLKKLSVDQKKKIRQIETGDCAVTDSCKLKKNQIQYIFHSPGPIYDKNEKEKSIEELRRTIKNILSAANDKKINSVAIPAISSGIYGFPKSLCAKTFLDVLQNNNQESELHVRLVNRDTETFEIFRDVFKSEKIMFSLDYKINPERQSILIVPFIWQFKTNQDKQQIITDLKTSILKVDLDDKLLQEFKTKEKKAFHILEQKTQNIEGHSKIYIVGFQKLNQQEEKQAQKKEFTEELYHFFDSFFEHFQNEKNALISIPLFELGCKMKQEEKLKSEDKKIMFQELKNGLHQAKIKFQTEIHINLIADQETIQLLEGMQPKI